MTESARPRLTIDVVSDVICPWCLIGTRRLELALEAKGETDAEIVFHPFLLDPTIPTDGTDLRARLRAKFGDPEAMFARVEAAARESGIPLDFSKVRRSSNTLRAHTLLRHARELGTQRALAKALFGAYFLDGLDIGDGDVLLGLATRHGFAPDQAAALLANEAEHAATTSEAAEASSRGIRGVPFTIFSQRYAVSGAQPVAVFEDAIARARSDAS